MSQGEGGGRPLKFKSVKKLQAKIDSYFARCDKGESVDIVDRKTGKVASIKRKIPYTITGLAIDLETTRETLCDYGKKDKFSDTIKTAKLRVENYNELQLHLGKHAAGPIFALKNFGWKDKTEIEAPGPFQVIMSPGDEDL
jgi:hypothetical protein